MWVRIKVRRPSSQDEVSTSAYANGGYRAGKPEVVLPTRLAIMLGFDVEHAELGEGIG